MLGAAGFVAGAALRKLFQSGIPVLALSRSELDLTDIAAGQHLGSLLRPEDSLVFAAAKAPVKYDEMLISNLQMGAAVCTALRETPVRQVVYISSDAVYADSDFPLDETSCAQPASLHGTMHLAREVMIANCYKGPICVLRPTLIYGANDPHNGYGPNRFCRLASTGEDIPLFGQGEELRDHVWVEDVAEIILRVLKHQSVGTLNVATGRLNSFRQIAEMAVKYSGLNSKVIFLPRSGPMPHNGYRPFSLSATALSFPDFHHHYLEEWLQLSMKRYDPIQ